MCLHLERTKELLQAKEIADILIHKVNELHAYLSSTYICGAGARLAYKRRARDTERPIHSENKGGRQRKSKRTVTTGERARARNRYVTANVTSEPYNKRGDRMSVVVREWAYA